MVRCANFVSMGVEFILDVGAGFLLFVGVGGESLPWEVRRFAMACGELKNQNTSNPEHNKKGNPELLYVNQMQMNNRQKPSHVSTTPQIVKSRSFPASPSLLKLPPHG